MHGMAFRFQLATAGHVDGTVSVRGSMNELLDRIRQSVDHVRTELGRQEPAEQE